MYLAKLLNRYPILRVQGELPVRITGFTADSKTVKPGFLYICIRGEKQDGHRFAAEAVHKGAAVIVAEHPLPLHVPLICVAGTRHFLSFIASRYYGEPSRDLNITAITGTNGKTTTAHYLYSIYRQSGVKAALMGTVGVKAGERYVKQSLTTPGAEELHRTLWQLKRQGISHVAMEVSSHALAQQRVDHCRFQAGVFTNLTREHLDYHKTMDGYFNAKLRLFHMLANNAYAVLNADDARVAVLAGQFPYRTWTYALENAADVRVKEICPLAGGGSFVRTDTPWGEIAVLVRMHGLYNVYNALAAATVALVDGVPVWDVVAGIESLRYVPGRLELLPSPPGIRVYLDYAHTPDGLEKVLQAVEEYPHNRIILVFGCRGNRDRGKRPQMGRIAETYADVVILTSDNPGLEDPAEIGSDIACGMKKKPVVITDREMAIHYALDKAKEGDIILITGKGRENYQLVGETARPYSDTESVSGYLDLKQ